MKQIFLIIWIQTIFEHIQPYWIILDHLGPFWNILNHIICLRRYQTILDINWPHELFETILDY